MRLKLLLSFFAILTAMTAWADVSIDETNFPDEKFRSFVLSQSYGTDGILSDEEIAAITKIDVSDKGIQSLKGIEYFTSLLELWCFRNQLTSLDVSQNTALVELWCYGNQLTTLDVSQNTALVILVCNVNKLTSLDVSGCTALESLSCYLNQLTALDLSNNTALKGLDCCGNQLTTLDLSNNTSLVELYCYQNLMTGTGIDALIACLPSISSGTIFIIYDEDEHNEMTTTQVTAAKAKGWTPKYFNGHLWSEYAGSEPSGITSPESSALCTNTFYNLGGLRTNGLAKGLNIVGGRKVWVK